MKIFSKKQTPLWQKMTMGLWVLSLLVSNTSCFSQGVAKGKRIDLSGKLNLDTSAGQFAQLFVPDYFAPPADGRYLLVFHFHGASWAAEDEVYKSHTNGVLFNIHLGGLSSPYQNYFTDRGKFQAILNLVKRELDENGIVSGPSLGHLIVTSFSAGYAGVREVLKWPDYYNAIDALTLADGLHATLNSAIMARQMQDFVRFARDARDNKKIMLLTHSSIQTYTYANTTETADYLISHIGARRVPVHIKDAIGTMISRCDTGRFHIRGYRGETASDHLKHLYHMDWMLEQAVGYLALSTAVGADARQPLTCKLAQNYPNPFGSGSPSGASTTTIPFTVGAPFGPATPVRLVVYNVLGRRVATLVDQPETPGRYSVQFDAARLPAGVYFCRLRMGSSAKTIKMLVQSRRDER